MQICLDKSVSKKIVCNMSFSSSSCMHLDGHSSVHLGRHNRSYELHHTIHSDIPFFGEDIGPISFRDWMWDTEKLVQQCLLSIVK